MKRIGLFLLLLSCAGCHSLGDAPVGITSVFSSAPLPEADCDRGKALLRYHMSPQQRAALTDSLRAKDCLE